MKATRLSRPRPSSGRGGSFPSPILPMISKLTASSQARPLPMSISPSAILSASSATSPTISIIAPGRVDDRTVPHVVEESGLPPLRSTRSQSWA